ncbi:hypothetical protein BpHYR1_010962 [Brachionus plicatilis]|uniref:Uncharacterized protein n=1 Tax=Brachionus plicatilis TaxID=10195 RepID=A0A3M7PGA3_BRAPC|nr:hypothetical protein BpHYR1_010962 [Brachionus plicatilis]
MVITNKKNIHIPEFIQVEDNRIEIHVSEIKQAINKRLYSIDRLFYLSKNVKVQFLKTFILPHFDYCLSLVLNSSDYNSLNNLLKNCFQHRIIKRLSSFIYKVLNNRESPKQLRSFLYQNVSLSKPHNLRNKFEYIIASKGKFNDRMEETFQHFFPKLINHFLKKDLSLNFNLTFVIDLKYIYEIFSLY